MVRYQFADGTIITDDRPFVHNEMQYPGVRYLTPEDIEAVGLLLVPEPVEAERPDDRYGFVHPDPNNPGQWEFVPFAPDVLAGRLKTYSASARYNKETGGFPFNGMQLASDRETQSKIQGAFLLASIDASRVINWKVSDGSFIPLDAPTITAVAVAIGNYVQACFDKENEVAGLIDGGTILTYEAVDAAYAAVA